MVFSSHVSKSQMPSFINSFTHGSCKFHLRYVIFKLILVTNSTSICYETALISVSKYEPQNFTGNKSTLD